MSSYRTREEIQEVRKTRDPITGFKDMITESGLVTADELKVKMQLLPYKLCCTR